MSVEASRLSVFAASRLPAVSQGKPVEEASDFASLFASESASGKPLDRPSDLSQPRDIVSAERWERPRCAAHHEGEPRANRSEENNAPTVEAAPSDENDVASNDPVETTGEDCAAPHDDKAPAEMVEVDAISAPLSDGTAITPAVTAPVAPALATDSAPVPADGATELLPAASVESAAVQAATIVSATSIPMTAQPVADATSAIAAVTVAADAPDTKTEMVAEGETLPDLALPEESALTGSLTGSDKAAVDAKAVQPQARSAEPVSAPAPVLSDAAKVAAAPALPIVLPQPKAQQSAEAVATLRALPIEIGMSALKGMKQFTIRLDPAELGKVEVKLSMDDEGKVQAKLTVDRVDTLYMLQRDARTLERAFDQAGLKTSPDSLAFNLRDSGQGQREQGRQDGSSFERRFGADLPDEPISDSLLMRADTAHIRQIASAARGGIDLAI
jgi:flagellar hook-length control protein FliK